MNSVQWIIRCVVWIFFQAILLSNVDLFGYADPMMYLMFFMFYPIEKSSINLMFFAFFSGLFLDYMSDTGGIYALSTLVVAYFRVYVFGLITGGSFDRNKDLNLNQMRMSQTLIYMFFLILMHHVVFYLTETFSIGLIFLAIKRIIVNVVLTYSLCVLWYFLFFDKHRH